MFSSLPWAAGPSGGGFVLCLLCLPFGFLFVYFLCMIWNLHSWVSLLIYLLFIDKKKERSEIQALALHSVSKEKNKIKEKGREGGTKEQKFCFFVKFVFLEGKSQCGFCVSTMFKSHGGH